MAFKNVFSEPFTNSTNGSFTGNFSEPHNTLCSKIWATPVLVSGGVRKPMEKTLFSSSLSIKNNLAPVFLCERTTPREFISLISFSLTSVYAGRFSNPDFFILMPFFIVAFIYDSALTCGRIKLVTVHTFTVTKVLHVSQKFILQYRHALPYAKVHE